MTNIEFSDSFTTLLNSYYQTAPFGDQHSPSEIVLDEYEKSVFLTKAQEEIVINLYNGKNPYGDSFESTEEMRRYLDSLTRTKEYSDADKYEEDSIGVSSKSIFYKLPDDLAFITLEQATFGDESLGCYNGVSVNVYPITQDEYNKVKNNPFRGPTKYKVIRLDCGNNIVEIVSNYNVSKYLVRYMAKPTPIILEDLPLHLSINGVSEATECKLNSILHHAILDRAVQLALQSKGISMNK